MAYTTATLDIGSFNTRTTDWVHNEGLGDVHTATIRPADH